MISKSNSHPWVLPGVFLIGLTLFITRLYDPYISVRTILVIASFLLLLLWKKKKSLHLNPLSVMVLLLFIFECLSLLWSFSASNVIKYSLLTFVSLLVVLIFSQQGYRDNLQFIYRLTTLLVFANVFFAIVQIVKEGWNPYGIHSFSANKNLLSSLLMLTLPVHILAYKNKHSKKDRIISYLSIILSLQLIIVLQSRSAYLGLLSFLFFCFLLFIRCQRNVSGFSMKKFLKRFYPVLVSLIIGTTFYLFSIDQDTREDFIDKINVVNYFSNPEPDRITPNTQNNYESIETRKILWRNSIKIIQEKPLTGVGKGSWSIAIGKHATEHLSDRVYGNKAYSHAHNDLLETLAETGVIGFLLFLMPIITIVLFGLKNAFTGSINFESGIISIGIVSFLIISLFDFPLQQAEHRFIFYFELLLLYQIIEQKNIFKSKRHIVLPKSIFIFLCIVFIGIGIIQIRSDFFALRAVQLEERKQNTEALYFLSKIHDRFYDITPVNFPVSYMTGKILMREEKYFEAMPYIKKALQINPFEPRILNDYGMILNIDHKYTESLNAFKKAGALAPYYEDPIFNLSATYYQLGSFQEALNVLNRLDESPKKTMYRNQILKHL